MRTLFSMALMVVTATGCDTSARGCTPGETRGCTCTSGRSGAQLCDSAGAFGTCACEGTGDDAGTDAGLACTPSEVRVCTCPDGNDGTQVCRSDGSGFTSCSGCSTACTPGSARACTCSDGNPGTQTCLADGSGYTNCASCTPSGCSVRDRGTYFEDTCTGEQICVCPGGATEPLCEGTGSCSAAFGRRYNVALTRVQLPSRAPDGSCWDDPGCGAPDPYVQLTVDGVVVGTTPAAADLYEGFWDPPTVLEVTLLAGSGLRLDVFDEDIAEDDGAFACVHDPITSDRLRTRSLTCTGTLGDLNAFIFAAP